MSAFSEYCSLLSEHSQTSHTCLLTTFVWCCHLTCEYRARLHSDIVIVISLTTPTLLLWVLMMLQYYLWLSTSLMRNGNLLERLWALLPAVILHPGGCVVLIVAILGAKLRHSSQCCWLERWQRYFEGLGFVGNVLYIFLGGYMV